jgi:acyl carrier protein
VTTGDMASWAIDDPRVPEILNMVAKETGVERARLVPGATIAGLDIASLDMVQAIFALESRFDVEIPVIAEKSGQEFATVGELVTHVLHTIDHGPAV